MEDFNKLIKYRSYYRYDFGCEALRVMNGEECEEAKQLYSHCVRDYFLEGNDKWALDIALDCIRKFTDEEIETIQRQGNIYEYHFGYGLHVRNHYVHPSMFHRYLMADRISGCVEEFIYTILLPEYKRFKS